MSLKGGIVSVISTVVADVYPDFAAFGVAKPYAVYQAVGGTPRRYADNTPADKRHTELQVTVWAATRLQASALIRQIEEAFCASAVLTATPIGEAVSIAEEDLNLYGSQQDFSIHSTR